MCVCVCVCVYVRVGLFYVNCKIFTSLCECSGDGGTKHCLDRSIHKITHRLKYAYTQTHTHEHLRKVNEFCRDKQNILTIKHKHTHTHTKRDMQSQIYVSETRARARLHVCVCVCVCVCLRVREIHKCV
jgi:hypothetical protein